QYYSRKLQIRGHQSQRGYIFYSGPLNFCKQKKLAEEGYRRNAKKCKEKFENVHKYYKRTKDSRAGRNDGKTYRFFRQLEAMNSTSGATAAPMASA
uniref:Myb/SANT-like DNA-binding domain-containing protein n=2 Tax=Aegilops tauschii subsp. strangulata TaxID=200361 RepID=A0A452YIX4_AEGTS